MKNLIKFTLVVLVLTFMFTKVYAPLMPENEESGAINFTSRNSSLNVKSTTVGMVLKTESSNPFNLSLKVKPVKWID